MKRVTKECMMVVRIYWNVGRRVSNMYLEVRSVRLDMIDERRSLEKYIEKRNEIGPEYWYFLGKHITKDLRNNNQGIDWDIGNIGPPNP